MSTTGNTGLDALADAIAARVIEQLRAEHERQGKRLYSIPEAARYLGRSVPAVRNLVARGAIPAHRRDNRVFLDRQDLDAWIELGKR